MRTTYSLPTTISMLVLDLGGVLIRLNYQKTIQAFIDLGIKDFEGMYTQAQQLDLFDRFETGQVSAQYFINQLKTFLPPSVSPNAIVHAWNEMILDFPPEHVALLQQLKKQYHLVLLSNTNELHVPVVRRAFKQVSNQPFEDFFHSTYYSHVLGMRKPHPDTFLKVCELQGHSPETSLFIDDTAQHITGAKQAGLHTIHLQDIDDLTYIFS